MAGPSCLLANFSQFWDAAHTGDENLVFPTSPIGWNEYSQTPVLDSPFLWWDGYHSPWLTLPHWPYCMKQVRLLNWMEQVLPVFECWYLSLHFPARWSREPPAPPPPPSTTSTIGVPPISLLGWNMMSVNLSSAVCLKEGPHKTCSAGTSFHSIYFFLYWNCRG